ncbi:MAG: hypothetical protein Q8O56_09730 [Solirubrobacteraceae bacterium]|nr:hypothetical protein [Solirubrobacteraceae bacterium]
MRIPRILLLLVVLSLTGTMLVACGSEQDEEPAEPSVATLEGEGFTVAMPGTPKREVITAQTSAGPVPITAYIAERGSDGFSLSVLTVPKGVKSDLDEAVKGAAASVKGTLQNTRQATYQGFPARDARITNARDPNGNAGTVFARVIAAKGRIFQLQFVVGEANVRTPPTAYTEFISSLKIA